MASEPITQQGLIQAASQVHYALIKNPSPHCPNVTIWVPWLEYTIGEVRRAFYEGNLPIRSIPTRTLSAFYEMEKRDQDPDYPSSIWNIKNFSSNEEAVAHYGLDVGLEANNQGDIPVLEWHDVKETWWIDLITTQTAEPEA
ncbi:uncharacterized protein BXZ73DRAFT_101984 [Epithele typhae]|uniref:uncharacterized protein n=1 Tax=Epithele typhae TaxID=378194 RepID=UPI002007FA1F|nr:uncharacterized protein BXZ73DRAFT_101984 [Epithele typhae]KAH9929921.1 hypothetical protein BXZ73DRAFT_101984 [Epithele typhae]